jgi:putative flippase GtrA
MEPAPSDTTSTPAPLTRDRVNASLRSRGNWAQLLKFCAVGASGYVVNLAVYVAMVRGLDLHYLPAATISFGFAVTNNYLLNRAWTFRGQRGHVLAQGFRFLVVSIAALGANVLMLYLLVEAGLGAIPAQAIAIVVVTPVNFVGNKLWSFRR